MHATDNECDQEYVSLEQVQENAHEEDCSTDEKVGSVARAAGNSGPALNKNNRQIQK
jgi:hypothetical protein